MQLTKKCPKYTYRKDGVYYFSKVVPKDLLDLYCKPRIVKCLGTRSPQSAQFVAKAMLAKLEDYWLGVRLKRMEVPAAELLVYARSAYSSELPLMSDALDAYVQVKGPDKSKLFAPHAKRNVSYLIECLGDRPLDCYNGRDAGKFRDWLVEKGLGRSSQQRIFSVVKAIVNFNIREFGLNCRNAFSGVYLPSETVKKRQPISLARIKKLQEECVRLDDDIRWLVALISDTGMRLSEAVGLRQRDLKLNHEVPHVELVPHATRRLKTESSERLIPLVGASLWAAQRINESANSEYCFPRYCSDSICNSNSASAAINKWIKTIAGPDAVIHGLRHSFRDRLRAVEAPVDLIDQLGGWSLQSVGQGYGDGYSSELAQLWLQRIVVSIVAVELDVPILQA